MNGYQVETLQKKIDSFLGIPFAQPPTGNLRFRSPQPLNYTFDEYNATDLPPSCYQTLSIPVGEGYEDLAELAQLWNPNTNMSEDCLYLNIWRPDDGFNKAVMVSLQAFTFTYTYQLITVVTNPTVCRVEAYTEHLQIVVSRPSFEIFSPIMRKI